MTTAGSLLAALIAGAVAAIETRLAASDAVAAALAAASLALVWPGRRGRTALVALALCGAMAASAAIARDRVLDAPVALAVAGPVSDQLAAAATPPVELRGVLIEDAAQTSAGVRLLLDVSAVRGPGGWTPSGGRVQLIVSGDLAGPHVASWTRGREIRAPVLLRRIEPWRNPGGPDPRRQALQRRLLVAGTIKSAALIEVIPGAWHHEAAAAIRGYVRRQSDRWIRPIDAVSAGVVTAILIGDRAGLPADLTRQLQVAGTYHVIAISGGNVALMAVLTLGVARLALRGFRTRLGAALGIVAGYGWIVGDDPSVSRAVTAACVYLACRAAGVSATPLRVLGLVLALVLVHDPLLVIDVGAWLSFGATCGIVVLAAPLAARLGLRRPRSGLFVRLVLVPFVAVVSATVAAELALLPVQAAIFTRLGLAGLVLNLVAIPAMAVVQTAGLTLIAAGGWEPAARAAAVVAHLAVAALVGSSALVDVAPWLSWRVPPPAPFWIAAYYLSAMAIVSRGFAGIFVRRFAGVSLCVAATVIVTAPALERAGPHRGWLRLTMLDVGQGESLLAQFPSGQSLLIDAGGVPGDFDIGGRVVVPALWALGVRRLDWLAFTHGDLDHAGGATSVAEALRPREIWEGIPVPRDPLRQALSQSAVARGLAWRRLQRGDLLELGGVELAVLHPPAPDWERQRVRNDDSLLLRLRYGGVDLLLTGDISRTVESGLLASVADAGRLRVLKVAHHGSRTSTSAEWLRAAPPHVALISAGRRNPFGHPAREVLGRVSDAGAAIFRTDLDGAIQVETNGIDVRVGTVAGREAWFSLWNPASAARVEAVQPARPDVPGP